jgi:CheY-like chemotaxis protein
MPGKQLMKKSKIMIVEDGAIVGMDLTEKLSALGYQPCPEIIRYGEDVLDAAAEIQPDLILMDIRLKGEKDGTFAAMQVKEMLDIPVIFLTAYSDDKTLAAARRCEPFSFLRKPIKLEDLKISLDIALYKAGMEKKLKEKTKLLLQALDNVKELTGLLPICSYCKNIRDDKGYWNRLEAYIEDNSTVRFSHSICPDCAEKYYPELDIYKNK